MLLVVRAQPAIVWAAEFGAVLEGEGLVARLDVVLAAPPIGCIARHQRRLHAVLLAALLVPDFVAADLDLGRHQREAGLAQRGGLAPEDIGARSTQRRGHAGGSLAGRGRSWRRHRRTARARAGGTAGAGRRARRTALRTPPPRDAP